MKNAWEWEEEDIEVLIRDGVQESLTLDYKRCAALDRRNPARSAELSKDVSAFANSAGGVLVYGVIEENHLPTAIDSGYDPSDPSREWIEQIINSTIQRRIDGIRIKQIVLAKTHPGRVIYAVHVPQSKRAPHMAQDHVFYKRFNYQSVAMEEYEVRDVARRDEVPDLEVTLYLPSERTVVQYDDEQRQSKPVAFSARITNGSASPAMYYRVFLYIDKRIAVANAGDYAVHNDVSLQLADKQVPVTQLAKNFGVPGSLPVWEGAVFRLTSDSGIQLAVPRAEEPMDYFLACAVDSIGMQQKWNIWILHVEDAIATIQSVQVLPEGVLLPNPGASGN